MTKAVDWDVKQQNKQTKISQFMLSAVYFCLNTVDDFQSAGSLDQVRLLPMDLDPHFLQFWLPECESMCL